MSKQELNKLAAEYQAKLAKHIKEACEYVDDTESMCNEMSDTAHELLEVLDGNS